MQALKVARFFNENNFMDSCSFPLKLIFIFFTQSEWAYILQFTLFSVFVSLGLIHTYLSHVLVDLNETCVSYCSLFVYSTSKENISV